jgi:membrane protease YdiL (CAAX protease family)
MPLLRQWLGYWPDLTAFNDIVGNAALLAVYLALNWLLALVVVNVAFGFAHLYQGPSGVIQATVGGVLLGVLYLVTGRNLLAPILAHGIGNSIDFTVMYLGLYPGVGN